MRKLTVTKVDFYDEDTATVTLASLTSSIDVFCHLCEYKIGDKVDNLLHVLDSEVTASSVLSYENLTDEKTHESINQTGPYSYMGTGTVVDQENCIIEVEGFLIELEDLPYKGSIEFTISRLDI